MPQLWHSDYLYSVTTASMLSDTIQVVRYSNYSYSVTTASMSSVSCGTLTTRLAVIIDNKLGDSCGTLTTRIVSLQLPYRVSVVAL